MTNFRSISRAEKLPLGDFTVLLGPNNEGKSNILQAMVIGMRSLAVGRRPPRIGRRSMGRFGEGYEWDRDFPQHLQDSSPEGRTTMRFDFELTQAEVDEFYEEIGSRLNAVLPISLSFSRTGVTFNVRKPRHGAALSAKRDEIASFVAARVEVQYIQAVRTGANAAELIQSLLAQELHLANQDNEEYQSALRSIRALQQPVFDRVSQAVADNLKALLPDVQSVRIEDEGREVSSRSRLADVRVIVDDGTPTELAFKGDGVQSLAALAMTQHYSASAGNAREFIVAVEEPEAHLHPRAIHGLRDALRETSTRQQVVVTTHSPLFVNRLDLGSNIIVRKNRAAPARNVDELRDALGVRPADNLVGAEMVLAVEGMTDRRCLEALISRRSDSLRDALRNGLFSIVQLGGGGQLRHVCSTLNDSLAVMHAFLDCDEAGRQARDAAIEETSLTMADVTMASCTGMRQSELEDLLRPESYIGGFREAFGVDVAASKFKARKHGKWSARMLLVFQDRGAEWTESVEKAAKASVADAVCADPDSAVAPSGEGVVSALVDALEKKLDNRTR